MKKRSKKKLYTIVITTLIMSSLAVASYYLIKPLGDRGSQSPNSHHSPRICTTENNQVLEKCKKDYVDLSKDEAVKLAKEQGYVPKVLIIKNKVYRSAGDIGFYGPSKNDNPGNLIYLSVHNGKVVDIHFPWKDESR